MSISVTSGYYTSGSTADAYAANFIPQIWSGKLQVKFYKSTVLGEITNNDWEGEIKGQGDIINIRTIPTITVSNYTKGMNLTNQVPQSTPLTLNINKGKYFSVVLDDVDKVQADVALMDMFTSDASQQMKIAIDGDVLGSVFADAATGNFGATAGVISGNLNLGVTGTPRQVTSSNVLNFLLDLGQALDEQNVPEDGRWVVIPAWMAAMIKNSDLKQAYLTGDSVSPLRNGKIGMIDRFTLYTSNNLTKVTDGVNSCWNIIAGTRDAVSFASQITEMETIRAQTTFGNIVRGLNVYGFKTVKPEALVRGYVRQ